MSPRPRTVSDAEILEATARSIARVGPARLTLADVAKEVGLSPATLVQRFGTRRGLLLALAQQGAAMTRAEFQVLRKAHPSPLEALFASGDGMTQMAETPESLANHLAFLQMDLTDEEFRAAALDQAEAMREELTRLLDEAVAQGELVACDTRMLGRTLQAVLNGSLIVCALRREESPTRWVRRDVETLLAPWRADGKRRP